MLEPQGVSNLCLCFFGATDVNLAKSDQRMGMGEISIHRQRIYSAMPSAARLLNMSTTPDLYRGGGCLILKFQPQQPHEDS
jgi:hypothetical protein